MPSLGAHALETKWKKKLNTKQKDNHESRKGSTRAGRSPDTFFKNNARPPHFFINIFNNIQLF